MPRLAPLPLRDERARIGVRSVRQARTAMARAPSRVNWSDHAFAKAELLGLARADVEQAVLSGHARRASNPKSADWLVDFGRYVVAYNHPDGDDVDAARIVTIWRT